MRGPSTSLRTLVEIWCGSVNGSNAAFLRYHEILGARKFSLEYGKFLSALMRGVRLSVFRYSSVHGKKIDSVCITRGRVPFDRQLRLSNLAQDSGYLKPGGWTENSSLAGLKNAWDMETLNQNPFAQPAGS